MGRMFPEFRDAPRWLELWERRMREHLADDFTADGAHRELCTQYHMTCLRDLSYVCCLAQANGQPSLFDDPTLRPRLHKLYDWLARQELRGLEPRQPDGLLRGLV